MLSVSCAAARCDRSSAIRALGEQRSRRSRTGPLLGFQLSICSTSLALIAFTQSKLALDLFSESLYQLALT